MNKLILAQGADHCNPDNLKKIIATINTERLNKPMVPSGSYNQYLYDEYSIKAMANRLSYSVEEKYDGFSYLNVDGRFFSKSLSTAVGTKGQPIEKTGHLPHISSILKHASDMAGGLDLHGEVYIPGGISDDVTKILGCTEDKAQFRLNQMLDGNKPKYMLIDIRGFNGKSLINEPHRIRRAILTYVYNEFIKPYDIYGFVQLTEELVGDPRDEFRRIVSAGGEGIIIKREDALYIPDKKPANNWIKGKKKVTHDVVIMGLNENGTGKNATLFGSIQIGHLIDGKLTPCGSCSSGLSDEMRLQIYNNADRMIANHQVIEIEAIQESAKSFRNAVFLRLRDDKDWTECNPVNIRVKTELV